MSTVQSAVAIAYDKLDDGQLVDLARSGEPGVFRTIMQRHNRRLYRVARGVLGDDAEAEDVVQETYVRAFENLAGFRGAPSTKPSAGGDSAGRWWTSATSIPSMNKGRRAC